MANNLAKGLAFAFDLYAAGNSAVAVGCGLCRAYRRGRGHDGVFATAGYTDLSFIKRGRRLSLVWEIGHPKAK